MRLVGLADDERVEPAPLGRRGMQHGGRHRVGAEGETSHRVGGVPRDEVEHDAAHERGGLAVQGHPAQVDVVVGLLPGRQHHPSVHDRLVDDLLTQPVPLDRLVAHRSPLVRRRCTVS